jgi:hypothetical protein
MDANFTRKLVLGWSAASPGFVALAKKADAHFSEKIYSRLFAFIRGFQKNRSGQSALI